MATVNEKIKNALNDYNIGLKEKLDTRFVKQSDFATDTFVTKVAGKTLSTNDFTDAYKDAIDGLSSFDPNSLTDTFVTQSVIDGLSSIYVQQDGAKVLSTNDFTNAYKAAIDGFETIYAKKTDVASVLKYQGTVEDFDSIPTDTTVGDVWNISVGGGVDENGVAIKAGDNVAKTETGFDVLAGAIDLSGYRKIHIGSTAPSDTSAIWIDTSEN